MNRRKAESACATPNGRRPLVLGRPRDGYALSSETRARHHRRRLLREIEPGDDGGDTGDQAGDFKPFEKQAPALLCILEHVYFSRPTASSAAVPSTRPAEARRNWAKEAPVDADLSAGSRQPRRRPSLQPAIGHPLRPMGHQSATSMSGAFIEPTEQIRNMGGALKLNVNRAAHSAASG